MLEIKNTDVEELMRNLYQNEIFGLKFWSYNDCHVNVDNAWVAYVYRTLSFE